MGISVLMSVYGEEKPEYLEQSLESVVNQTLKPQQIVIMKDGELTKELEKVLNKYKSQFETLIEIYSLTKKSTLGEVLNEGVEKCKCEYIARMDADDIAPLYRFETQMEILKNNPKLEVLGGYIEEYDENMEELLSIRKVPLTSYEIKKYATRQSPFNHGTVIMRKDTVIKVGNYHKVYFEDYDLWARMIINNCEMSNTNLILCKNRTGNSMYERRNGIKQIKKVIEIEKRLLEYKIINEVVFIENVLLRSIIALMPVKLKKRIYTQYIRK